MSLDLSATVAGKDHDETASTGLSCEVGSGELIDGLDDALRGAQEGE